VCACPISYHSSASTYTIGAGVVYVVVLAIISCCSGNLQPDGSQGLQGHTRPPLSFKTRCACDNASKAFRASSPGFLSGCTSTERRRYAFDTSPDVHDHEGRPNSSTSGRGNSNILHAPCPLVKPSSCHLSPSLFLSLSLSLTPFPGALQP
jgi:hypothetical protein